MPDNNNERIVDPSRWDEIGPLVGGYPIRPYEELREDPYGALPGFYAGERDGHTVLAFQPGWDGVDGEDAVHWAVPWPAVAQVREAIASRLISSWLVQDRDDAPGFYLGDEPGSIMTPWGAIPARVIFAPRHGAEDAPWENLNAILDDVDRALEAGAPAAGGFVDWRLRNTVPAGFRTDFSHGPDGGFGARFTPARAGYVVVFLWDAGGSPCGGVREEYEDGAVGIYDAIPVPGETDLVPALLIYA